MRKTGMMVSLTMQSCFTIITLLRKVTEYIVSTLLTLKKLKINNYNHNSTEESDRIHREYSAHFEKVEVEEYSPYHTVQGVKYIIPEPDYYNSNMQQKQYQKQQNQNVYLPPPPRSRTYAHGTVEEEEEQGA